MAAAQLQTVRKNKPILDGKQAVQAAFAYFRGLFNSLQVSDLSLEEVEMSGDGKFWLVTLGFNEPPRKNPRLPDFLHIPVRKLKVFKVDARSGQVLAMKIRPDE